MMTMTNTRKILMFSIVGAVVALLATGLWLYSRSGSGRLQVPGNVNASATPASITCDTVSNTKQREACRKVGYDVWSRGEREAAEQSGQPERCNDLTDISNRDICRTSLSERSSGAVPCSALEDSGRREGCQLSLVIGGEDLPACDAFTSQTARETCQKELVLNHLGAGLEFCDRYDAAFRSICVAWYWKNTALVEYDPRVCQKITDAAEVKRCYGLFSADTDGDGLVDRHESSSYFTDPAKPDTDNDGLGDFEEARVYKTDPIRPDTDGDGFSDGQEVQNGFNPNGPGKLQP